MISFTEKHTKIVRDCSLEWHCHKIVLSQPKLSDGYEFTGYGIVKSQKGGTLSLEFICLESNKRLSFGSSVPKDILDENQNLVMYALTIDGTELHADELTVEIDFQQMMHGFPMKFLLGIKEIEFMDTRASRASSSSFLSFEFSGKASIPFNKSNTTESTLGSESSEWNQSDIEFDGIEIKIIKFKGHMAVFASGSNFEVEKLRDSIIFYIGFSSGVMVQPYFERRRDACSSKCIIRSIDNKLVDRDMYPPMCGSISAQKNDPLEHHYDLLKNIYRVSIERPDYFEVIYSQWERIWHSFFTKDISVPMLTVSIAVEGILNDVFIPAISDELRDDVFEKEKIRIKRKIDVIDDVLADHLATIKSSIDRWGNVHPKRALQYLLDRRLIEKTQIKCWEKLRNSSAHPRLRVQDEIRMRKNIERTVVCLGLFYRLSLNVFSYKGQQFSYANENENELAVFDYVEILH